MKSLRCKGSETKLLTETSTIRTTCIYKKILGDEALVPAFALSFMPEVPQVKQRTTSLRAPQQNKQRTCNLLNAFSAWSQDAGSPKDAAPARGPPLPRLGAT